MRALNFYHRRSAIQASTAALERIVASGHRLTL